MALEQTITIVNNSGKIIKTGKQLYTIFKEAQGTYKDKKAQIRSDQALQRSQSFDAQSQLPPREAKYVEDHSRYYPPRAGDQRSEAGSIRSRRSLSQSRSRQALTLDNLKTHSEVSGMTPSRAPVYKTYAEPIPMDHALARAPSTYGGGAMIPRRSTGDLVQMKPRKEIDMDLAYGSIPPDLKDRTDLDPQYVDERQATSLVQRVEGLLTEAKCLHHSATHTMAELQKNPDHAAAVALTLAELSKIMKKTSPAFLGLLKSGSPAVFSLLSSPQFLIGTSIAAGLTVICFGGWKIVQRMKEAQAAREVLAYDGVPMDRPAPMRTQSEYGAGMDEALIIDDDLSSIETWRRGIVPYGEEDKADMELITPLADKETRSRYADDFDTKSHRSTRTSKTHESSRSHRSHKSESSHRSHRSRRDDYAESVASSERSHRSSKSKRSDKSDTRSIDSRSTNRSDLTIRTKTNRNSSSNMLKALFKNKDKKERSLVMA
ncbi:hypothetical protein F66182_3107 [Fusarium sp. NRRL 66182]|nr:hypothetical protein F66182_3107 [Fusarium sp. NRRL 66182]